MCFITFQIVCHQIPLHWSRRNWTHNGQSESLVSKGCYPTTILCALHHTILYYRAEYKTDCSLRHYFYKPVCCMNVHEMNAHPAVQ